MLFSKCYSQWVNVWGQSRRLGERERKWYAGMVHQSGSGPGPPTILACDLGQAHSHYILLTVLKKAGWSLFEAYNTCNTMKLCLHLQYLHNEYTQNYPLTVVNPLTALKRDWTMKHSTDCIMFHYLLASSGFWYNFFFWLAQHLSLDARHVRT